MKDQIASLQDQVGSLFSSLNELRVQKSTFDAPPFDQFSRDGSQVFTPMHPPSGKPRMRHPRFHGPTSSAFNFDVARSSLQDMGIAPVEEGIQDDLTTAHATPAASPPHVPALSQPMHPSKDPIWAIKKDEALRLCRVYEEEIGIMYPLVDINQVTHQVNLLYTFMEAAMRTGLMHRGLGGADGLEDDSTNLIKLILATTLIVEGGGESELGRRLYLSVKPVIESKIWETLDLKTIQLLGLMVSLNRCWYEHMLIEQATYHFHTDDDALAYRIIGVGARMCLEMGLHRRDALAKSFPDEAQWPEIVKIFWSIYSLDRRWSFGTGLPFVIQDEDIDPNLPEPVIYTHLLLIFSCLFTYRY